MTTTQPEKARAQNRLALFMIIGVTIAVIAASTALFTATSKGLIDLPSLLGTKNNGTLITPPRSIAELPLRDETGAAFVYAEQKRRWTLLIPAVSTCDKACSETLYLTRQVDLALGRESTRVRRYLLTTDGAPDAAFAELVQEQHHDLQTVDTSAVDFDRFVANIGDSKDPPSFYLVDPYGWLMMFYTSRHDGKAVLADLKFLVKNSHENETSE